MLILIRIVLPNFGNSLFLVTFIFVIFTIVFANLDVSLPIVFFFLPIPAIFDDFGMTYTFNIIVGLLTLKQLLIYIIRKQKLDYRLILIVFLFIYNIILSLFGDVGLLGVLSIGSNFIAILLFYLLSNKRVNFYPIFMYMFIGYILSLVYGLYSTLLKYGINIPDTYRLMGGFRDPNYFGIVTLFIATTCLLKFKGIIKYLTYLIIVLIGALSVSKTYLFLLILSAILLFTKFLIDSFFKKRVNLVVLSLPLFAIFVFLIRPEIFNIVIDLFEFRFSEYTFLTGRDQLLGQYLVKLFVDPINLIIGRGITYSSYYKVTYSGKIMPSHNTYLDIILSYGLFVGFVFVLLIISIIKKYFINDKIKLLINSYSIMFIVTFAVCIAASSYIMMDMTYLLFAYLLFAIKDEHYSTKSRQEPSKVYRLHSIKAS